MQQKEIARFIAGAVCPACHKLDKILLTKEATKRSIRCVNCGYSESKNNVSDDIHVE